MCFLNRIKNLRNKHLKAEIERLNQHIKIIETERDQLTEINKYQKDIIENSLDELIYPLNNMIDVESLLKDYKRDFFRDYRLHNYVKEALNLISDKDKIITGSSLSPLLKSNKLNDIFLKYSSDKASRHNYGSIYEYFINGRDSLNILEIGIGSVNDFNYAGGIAAGSLKAWREFLPKSIVIGADIDPKSVEAAGEQAFLVDQTNIESLNKLKSDLWQFGKFDFIIDDGFHDLHANLKTLIVLNSLLIQGGKFIIEDVHQSLIDLWIIIANALNLNIEVYDLSDFRPNIKDNILVVFTKS